MLKKLQSYFIAGILVLLPFVLTIFIIFWLFVTVDGLLDRVMHSFLERLGLLAFPGVGFLSVIVLILITGIIARNYFGRKILSIGDIIVTRIPLINRIYLAIKQISKAFLTEQREVFRNAVLIEYPRKGVYSIAFYTKKVKGEIQEKLENDLVSVFVPTTPNPTSGYLLFIPSTDVITLDMSIEEALKLVISGGVVVPDEGNNKSLNKKVLSGIKSKEIAVEKI